jgi:hypothetical protein
MRDGLLITADWLNGEPDGDPTAAFIGIEAAGVKLLRAENRWSGSLVDRIPLSAAPLAVWLAQNWWRLRWEPEQPSPSPNWRMAHELAAAGEGFIWPRITITSDGKEVMLRSRRTPADDPEIIHYLHSGTAAVGGDAFEAGVDRFLSLTIERLQRFSRGADLEELWAEVRAERADPARARYRRLEAMMGSDPGEAPAGKVEALLALEAEAGARALPEIAVLAAGRAVADIADAVRQASIIGRVRRDVSVGAAQAGAPADVGRRLASEVRGQIGLDGFSPVGDGHLADLLGLTVAALTTSPAAPGPGLPVAAAVTDGSAGDRFRFRRSFSTGRRFESARLLGDALAETADYWHLAADVNTARQKVQRAFAAEFLAPIRAIEAYLDGDHSPDAIEGAGEYFEVSSQTVGSQLANHGVISRSHPSVPRI